MGVARTSQLLRKGTNASDAVVFVHHILRVLQPGKVLWKVYSYGGTKEKPGTGFGWNLSVGLKASRVVEE